MFPAYSDMSACVTAAPLQPLHESRLNARVLRLRRVLIKQEECGNRLRQAAGGESARADEAESPMGRCTYGLVFYLF